MQIPKVRKLSQGNTVSSQDEVTDLESSAIRAYVHEFSDALHHKEIHGMRGTWCHMAEQFLVTKGAGET